MVFVILNAICKFVCLNRFVIFFISGQKYVNVVHIFVVCGSLFVCSLLLLLCCICWFIRFMKVVGNPLFFAIVCMVFHSFCFSLGFNGKECICER